MTFSYLFNVRLSPRPLYLMLPGSTVALELQS